MTGWVMAAVVVVGVVGVLGGAWAGDDCCVAEGCQLGLTWPLCCRVKVEYTLSGRPALSPVN